MRLIVFISPFTLVEKRKPQKFNDLARIIQHRIGYTHCRFKPRILKFESILILATRTYCFLITILKRLLEKLYALGGLVREGTESYNSRIGKDLRNPTVHNKLLDSGLGKKQSGGMNSYKQCCQYIPLWLSSPVHLEL